MLYVVALALAPLSLVQATSAGGVGVLAALAHKRGDVIERADWAGVGLAIGGLGADRRLARRRHDDCDASGVAGARASGSSSPLAAAARCSSRRAGLAAGTLYAAGDVATKGAVFGGAWLVLVPVLLAAHGLAFVALQLGFQRADALETAGTASLLTNALPIAAGVVLFHEHLPGGAARRPARRRASCS